MRANGLADAARPRSGSKGCYRWFLEDEPCPEDRCRPIGRRHRDGDADAANRRPCLASGARRLRVQLAKVPEPGDSREVRLQPDLSRSPTITSPAQMRGLGVILGTAAYR